MAEHSPPIEQPRRRARPETSAWLMLVAFFLVFCALVTAACVAGWRYYTQAMVPLNGSLVRVHAPAGVSYQDKNSAKTITPSTPCETPPTSEVCQLLKEGDRVQAKPEAGYGPVASVVLPNRMQIDMWAHPTGADLTLAKYQVSRWTRQRQEVELEQSAGYARYDIPDRIDQPYTELVYSVVITKNVSLILSPGGSYSVDVPHYDAKHLPLQAPSGMPILAEVAVRAGSAEVQTPQGTVLVHPGEKVQIDSASVPNGPMPAKWQLIRDGDFVQYQPGAYAPGSDTWHVKSWVSDPTVAPEEQNARFNVYRGCRPETPSFCGREQKTANIAQFSREGDQSKSFGIQIQQDLDIDISEFRSLEFTMWARIIRQSIPRAGVANVECPITVRFLFKQNSNTDAEQLRFLCFYQESTEQPLKSQGQFIYQGVNQSAWYQLRFQLRDPQLDLLSDARYLKDIVIYANGHDYIAEITDVSLVATQ